MSLPFKHVQVKEERIWFPEPNEFRPGHNPHYLNSLVVGVCSPILHLPQILWFNSIWPFFKSLTGGIVFIFASMMMGIMGRANGFRVVDIVQTDMTQQEKEMVLRQVLQGSGFIAVPLSETSSETQRETL